MKYIILVLTLLAILLVFVGFSIGLAYELFISHNPRLVEIYTNTLYLEILWLTTVYSLSISSISINSKTYPLSDGLVKAIALIAIGVLMIVKLTYIL